jgi:hypothetical protein
LAALLALAGLKPALTSMQATTLRLVLWTLRSLGTHSKGEHLTLKVEKPAMGIAALRRSVD